MGIDPRNGPMKTNAMIASTKPNIKMAFPASCRHGQSFLVHVRVLLQLIVATGKNHAVPILSGNAQLFGH